MLTVSEDEYMASIAGYMATGGQAWWYGAARITQSFHPDL